PPFHESCSKLHAELTGDDFAIIYPNEFTKIFIPKDVTGKEQSAIFQANHSSKEGKLFWQVDDEFLGETSLFHTMKIEPKLGRHKLTVMNETGKQKIKFFEVVME
ncbi:MAG: penicillin-binding protein, partial [Bacteroidota bacterium]